MGISKGGVSGCCLSRRLPPAGTMDLLVGCAGPGERLPAAATLAQRQPRFPRVRLLAWQLSVSWPEEASCSCRTRIPRTTIITELSIKRKEAHHPGSNQSQLIIRREKESKRPASQILGRTPATVSPKRGRLCTGYEVWAVLPLGSCNAPHWTKPPATAKKQWTPGRSVWDPPPTRAGKTEAKKGPGAGSFGQGQISTMQRWGGRGWGAAPGPEMAPPGWRARVWYSRRGLAGCTEGFRIRGGGDLA